MLPCPSRLKELIALANLEPDSETRKTLQAIARAFQAKRAKSKTAPAFIEIQTQNALKLHLVDVRIGLIREEIELALREVEPPSNIGLIRECTVCPEIFWAGRDDTVACSLRHAERWGKREQRRKKAEREVKRVIDRTKRQQSRRTRLSVRLYLTVFRTSTSIWATSPGSQSWSRKAVTPRTTASYKPSASTSTECLIPEVSR